MAATAVADESREYLCFWFSLLLLTLLSHFHLFGDVNETKIRETSGNGLTVDRGFLELFKQ